MESLAKTQPHVLNGIAPRAWAALLGVGLFVSGAILSMVWSPAGGSDESGGGGSGGAPSARMNANERREPVTVPSSAAHAELESASSPSESLHSAPSFAHGQPILFDQPHLIFELKLNAARERWQSMIEEFMDELASRLDGLGEQDIRFDKPGAHGRVGSLSFRGPGDERWVMHARLISHDVHGHSIDRVRLVGWAAELLIVGASADAMKDSNVEAIWPEIQDRIRLPLIDAAADLKGVQMIYPIDSERGRGH